MGAGNLAGYGQAQAHAVDQWSFYQSKSTKQHIAENTAELIRIQNETLVEFCAANPERFVAYATAALQHPELAAEQVEHAVKKLGFRGVSVGGSVTKSREGASKAGAWARPRQHS